MIKDWVTKTLTDFWPDASKEKIQEKINSFGENPDINQVKRLLENEYVQQQKAWNEIYQMMFNLFTSISFQQFNEQGEESLIPLIPDPNNFTEQEKSLMQLRLRQLKNKVRGNSEEAKAEIKRDMEERLPDILLHWKDKTPYEFEFLINDQRKTLIDLHWDIDLLHYYITKLVPIISKYIKYRPFYEKQVRDIFSGYGKDNVDNVLTKLTSRLAKLENRKAEFEKDEQLRSFVEANPNLVTMEELAGHVDDINDAKEYVKLKLAITETKGISNNSLFTISRYRI